MADEQARARRAAHAAYNRLLWRLAKLPTDHPDRRALVAQLAAAARAWRARLGKPDTEPSG